MLGIVQVNRDKVASDKDLPEFIKVVREVSDEE